MRRAVIVSFARTPMGRAYRGAFNNTHAASLAGHAVAEAGRLGPRAILLVGDAPYYARFGFSAEKTGSLSMPGPYERDRFLGLELVQGALDGAKGVLKAAGRKLKAERARIAA